MSLSGAFLLFLLPLSSWNCKKEDGSQGGKKTQKNPIQMTSVMWADRPLYGIRKGAEVTGSLKIRFSNRLDTQSAKENIKIKFNGVSTVDGIYRFEDGDSTVVFKPNAPLKYFSKYTIPITENVRRRNLDEYRKGIDRGEYIWWRRRTQKQVVRSCFK